MLHRVVAGPDRTAHAGEPGLSCRSSSARTLCIWNGVAETLSTRPSFRPTNTSPVWPRIGRINAPASSADRQRSRNASRTTSAAGATPLLIPTKPIATMTAVRLATSFQGLRRGCGGGAGMTAGGPDRCNSSSAASKALLEMPAAVAAARRSATAVLPKRAASSWLARSSRRVATGSGRTSVSGFWRRCCTGYLRNARSAGCMNLWAMVRSRASAAAGDWLVAVRGPCSQPPALAGSRQPSPPASTRFRAAASLATAQARRSASRLSTHRRAARRIAAVASRPALRA